MEAQFQYRQCLSDAKIQQDELVKVKERIISHIRKLICQGDTVLKEVGMKLNKTVICLPVSMLSRLAVQYSSLYMVKLVCGIMHLFKSQ